MPLQTHAINALIPFVNGEGKIRVDDSLWKIRGADCLAGTLVEVTDVDGVVLKIKPKG